MKEFKGSEGKIEGGEGEIEDGIILYIIHFSQLLLNQQPLLQKQQKQQL